MLHYVFMLACIALLSCGQQTPQVVEPVAPKDTLTIKYLALGDSYTKGQSVALAESFPYQLQDTLQQNPLQKVEVKVIAQTGWTTQNLLDAIVNANLKDNYDWVTLLIGVNNQYQNKPISLYQQQFPQLIEKAIQLAGGKKEKVLIISIPDYAYTPYGQGNAQISADIDNYNYINQQYAMQYGIKYINITDISRQGLAKPELVAYDGLHPSAKMYLMWVERIYAAMQ